ncbi:hypothetical protein D7Z54_15690 [Salibacterium salarium]|uniref:TRAP-type C4-dicarboxylate transport system, substrate-binding protein n=2 Tax=Salibacterium salarium TaxID=284579 RepID=A0A3R9P478_9BACI|nr:hypothetical protein D7Z54_15690 [Salibacterium salarium]
MKSFTPKSALLVLLMGCMIVVIAACGDANTDDTGNTESGSDTTDEDQSADSADSLEFTMGHMNSPEHVQDSMAMTPFAEEVSEKTEGRVNFEIYPGGALGGPAETYDNIVTGGMDAGWGLQGYNSGKWEIHTAMHLPFLANGSAADLSVVAQELYNQFPEIQEEYDETKLLWAHAADPYAIITNGTPVESFEDVKGLKLRTPSDEAGDMIEAWGATPVSLPAPEIYDAMQKGVIDGGVLPVAALADFNIFDVVDYVTLGKFNTSLFYVMMNQDKWDQIPAEDQEIIEGMIGKPMAETAGEAFDQQREDAYNQAQEDGIEFIELEDAELQKFKDASEVVTENWLENMESQGVDGQAILDKTKELIEEKQ